MKLSTLPLLFFALLVFVSPLQAKKKKHPGDAEPSPTPGGTPALVSSDLPSVTLQPFLDANLSAVLAPLDKPGFERPEILASLKAGYADAMAVAPAARKPACQAAQMVCDAITAAIAERQSAVSALKGATVTHSSESDNQPKGGRKAIKYETKHDDAFFSTAQRDRWAQRAGVLRQNIMTIYLCERDLERQSLAAAAPAPAAGTANPAPAAPAPAPKPVEGKPADGAASSD